MEMHQPSELAAKIAKQARRNCGRTSPFSSDFQEVKNELRTRRKYFLGSYISLKFLVYENVDVDENAVVELSRYLAANTVRFWKEAEPEAEEFCFRFYQLSIYSLCNIAINDTVDDIISMAELLCASREYFISFLKLTLPANLIGEMFDFLESFDDSMCSAYFAEAVLGAVCVLLGVLADPETPEDANFSKEGMKRE